MKRGVVCFKLFFFIGLFLASFSSSGGQKSFPADSLKSLLIKAPALDLKIKGEGGDSLTVKWEGDLLVQANKGLLSIQSPKFNSRKSKKALKKPISLEISGPSRPLELFAFSAQARFSSWAKPLFISSFKGHIKAFKTEGDWEISLKEGSIDMSRHKGALSVHGFHVQQSLSDSQGDFKFQINEGDLKASRSQGRLSWTSDKAKISLKRFKGTVKGFSQSGEVRAAIQPETADLFVGEGVLRVSFMGQAPKITAYTERGKIYGARRLHKRFSGKSTKVSGRIKGALKKGEVFLKSDTANIHIN